jgi:ubiquinone/menaquinone biosynthesis C-methylase UbiE
MRFDHVLVCPKTHSSLKLETSARVGDAVSEGTLVSADGTRYAIADGLPNLVLQRPLQAQEAIEHEWYQHNYEVYDDYLPLTARTFGVDETEQRLRMVEMLQLEPHHKVLETGAGTGRDSILLAGQLGPDGELHVTDVFDKILQLSRPKLANARTRIEHCVADAVHLPYANRYFDAYYHFGGFNGIFDKKRAFAEISRVVKPGGRVVVGDESMAPWLRPSTFGAVLMNSNPHYRALPPLQDLPVSARDVTLHHVIGGAFYVMAFTMGDGEPYADLDFEIPGPRGGTHRSRLYGQLEGVSEEAVRLARIASASSGQSMHRWLDCAVRDAAERQLKNSEERAHEPGAGE